MRAAFLFALSMISTAVLAQDAPTAKRPNVGGKPLVQAKPSGPAGCKLLERSRVQSFGRAIAWRRSCEQPPTTSTRSLSDQAVGAIPKGAQ